MALRTRVWVGGGVMTADEGHGNQHCYVMQRRPRGMLGKVVRPGYPCKEYTGLSTTMEIE